MSQFLFLMLLYLVLDETPDMTKVCYDLVWKFLLDMGQTVLFLFSMVHHQGNKGFLQSGL